MVTSTLSPAPSLIYLHLQGSCQLIEQQGTDGKLLWRNPPVGLACCWSERVSWIWVLDHLWVFGGWGWLIMLNCSAVARFVSLCSHILGSNTRLLETNVGRIELKIFPKIPGLKTYGNVFFKPFEWYRPQSRLFDRLHSRDRSWNHLNPPNSYLFDLYGCIQNSLVIDLPRCPLL